MHVRWCRVVLRLACRARWHWEGILLWLIRRPEIRGLPIPWPSVDSIEAYEKQTAIGIPATTLAKLIELRTKLGFKEAFLENEKVTQALESGTVKKGVFNRVRAKAREEEIKFKPRPATAANYNPAVMDLIGPKGGLPRTKTELSKVAVAFGIDPTGMTSDTLKASISSVVASRRRVHEEPSASSGLTPPRESGSYEEKVLECVDPKEQAEIQRTVANATQQAALPAWNWLLQFRDAQVQAMADMEAAREAAREELAAMEDEDRAVYRVVVAQLRREEETRRRQWDRYMDDAESDETTE